VAVNLTGIDLSGSKPGTASKVTSPLSVPTGGQDAAEAAPQQGEVSITSTAALLAHLERALSQLPAVDPKRVSALRDAISTGAYTVQSDQVASGLIQSERTLARLSGKGG